ncbi:uncharacterized protein N0V89_007583 [Didymosphaeria variabile]|uniref:Acid protease n=1 Tax=Didymosphaeria variabile TaxID=1932322 RepID=A0A9W8XL52_9PLEO|nr:uncharacterized protein N0V89_007583 [Didymosphaeria variabile]KAJ4352236.1 hypothetical protein N0V89_007583 [Didymosphaeria variabile]
MFSRKRAETVNITAEPRIVGVSGNWKGNDGDWSTFYINVGDKDNNGGGQNFEILPSTQLGVTVLPYTTEWCDTDCAASRGVGIVNGNQETGVVISPDSTTWKGAGTFDVAVPALYNVTDDGGIYGLDYLGIGKGSKDSYVAPEVLIAASKSEDFYLGQLGLSAGATNAGGGKGNIASFINKFNDSSVPVIPSMSYGYAAGAKYKRNGIGVLGSLVLGGYDETRINPDNQVSIKMPSVQNNSLIVGVQSISYTPQSGVNPIAISFTEDNVKGFSATIDSTFPYLWLPDAVCDHFAENFNLNYNKTTNFYTLNETGAANNKQQNATVQFKIGSGPFDSGPSYTTISLPWTAFDLTYTEPSDKDDSTKYFPIKKSPTGVFVLGRTLLQEAYIIVDYERTNFTVSQAPPLNDSPAEQPVAIHGPYYVAPTPTPLPTGGGSKGLSGGAIAGIVIGILAVALGAAFAIFIWWKKRRERRNAPPAYKEAAEIDTSTAGDQIKHRRVSELDSQPPGAPKPTGLGGFYGDERDRKDLSPFPTISEMDSPPAELYSPPTMAATPHSEGSGADYFTTGAKLGRRGATREASANNTPGASPPFTPIAELPGDDGGYAVGGQHFDPVSGSKGSPNLSSGSVAKRDPSGTRSRNNIDEVMKRTSAEPSPTRPAKDGPDTEGMDKKTDADAGVAEGERRPSHTRGASDATVQSDTTVVSQPTPDELERWALAEDGQPRRPLSE